ncbi:hypothetical protein Tcan_03070 [Toxocara canis]|uniref:G-protein coupled receptors family 1 profile domain-containing protein n=1 Tax=Toxocara canis TaxID=6265 RepID=A0A0B2VEF8_TOXCA|nr:hypothetical protein Tcan_03070 [Toxocara canis]
MKQIGMVVGTSSAALGNVMALAAPEYNFTSYIVVGTLVVIFNLPLCIVIVSSNQLRHIFGVLAALFSAGALTGICSIAKGFSRLVAVNGGLSTVRNLSALHCIQKPVVLMDQFTFPSVSMLLMVNSFDRLLVVSVPIFYFRKSATIVACQIIFAFLSIIVLEAYSFAVATVMDAHATSTFCRQSEFLPAHIYRTNIIFRLTCSILSVLMMLVVLYRLTQRRTHSNKIHGDDKQKSIHIHKYMTRQNNFTKAMLFSCCFTLLLDTVPNIVVVCAYQLGADNFDDYVTYTRIVCMMNAINMALVVMCRKTDIRMILLKFFRYPMINDRSIRLFSFRLNYISATTLRSPQDAKRPTESKFNSGKNF